MQQPIEEQATLAGEPTAAADEATRPGRPESGRGPGPAAVVGMAVSAGLGAGGGAVAGAAGAVLVLDHRDDDAAVIADPTAQPHAQQAAAQAAQPARQDDHDSAAPTDTDAAAADETELVDDTEEAGAPHHAHYAAGAEESRTATAAVDDGAQDGDSEEVGGGPEDGFEAPASPDSEDDGRLGPGFPLTFSADAPAAPGGGGQASDEQAGDAAGSEQPQQPEHDPHGEHHGHSEPEQPAEEPAEEEAEQSAQHHEEPVVLPEPVAAAGQAPAVVEFTANGVVIQNLDGSLHVFDQDEGHFLLKQDGTREQVPGSPLHLISFDPAGGSAVIDNIYDEQPPFVLNQAGHLTFLPAADGGSVSGLELIGSNALRGWARIATPDGQVYELRPNGEIYRINEYGFQTPLEGHIPGHLHLKTIEESGLVQVTYEGSVINLHADGSTAFVAIAPEAVNSYGVADDFAAAAELAAAADEPPAQEPPAESPVDEEPNGGGGQAGETPDTGGDPEPTEEEPVTPVAPDPILEEPEPVDELPEGGADYEPADDVPGEDADELKFATLTFVETPVAELPEATASAFAEPGPPIAELPFVEGSGLADLNLSFAGLDVFELDDDLDAADSD